MDVPILMANIRNPEIAAVNNNLHTFLSMNMKGKALTAVQNSGSGNGFEAVRLISESYRPRGQLSQHGMMQVIIAPTWFTSSDHAKRGFIEVIGDWEKLITDYELVSNERVSNAVRCSAIMLHAPKNIKEMLNACQHNVREDYDLMRLQIRDY